MIRIISGIPGAGKTLLAVYFMYIDTSINGYDNYLKSCKKIKSLNEDGFQFSYPKEKHTTYFNGQAIFKPLGHIVKNAYTFNPWEMGLPSEDKKTISFLPHSNIYIDEAQRFYNSRLSMCFPEYVSRFYELHRQFDLNITLIAQRPGLIDLNIREIAEELCYIEDLEKEEDVFGQLVYCKWTIRKFKKSAELDKYLEGHNELGEEIIIECNENLYSFYDTKFFRFLFLNKDKSEDFLQTLLKPFKYSPEICAKLSKIYSATAPEDYYKRSKKEVTIYAKGNN